MADNRGLPSATSSKSIDGLHKTKSIDMNTLSMMDKVYGKYASFIKDSFGSLEGFEKILDKSSKEMTDLMQKQKKDADERSETMKEMMKQYDKNSKEMKLVRKEMEKENKIAKEELAKKQDETMKNFIKQSFKNESSNKQIKYLNNKYSKGNNLAKTSNEYYDELAKLKSDALDAFGAGFENTKGYRKALENLNDKYASDMKDAWKEDFKENHKVLGGIAGGIKDTFERNKKELQGLLGPLNLIIGPMQEFFGGFGKIFSLASGGVKWLFKKFTKKNPTATDVLKSGASGVGALYIANKLEDIFGSTQGGGESLLDSLKDMPSVMGKLSSLLGKVGGLGGVAGIGMMGVDAVKGFMEFGTLEGAGLRAITGDSALENAVKGAFLGFKLGGPIGAIIGALGGAAIHLGEKWMRERIMGEGAKMDKMTAFEKLTKGVKDKEAIEAYSTLMNSMSEDDFSKLVRNNEDKQHNAADWVRALSSGQLSSLNNNQLYKLAGEFGSADLSKRMGWTNYLGLMKLLGKEMTGAVADEELANMLDIDSMQGGVSLMRLLAVANELKTTDKKTFMAKSKLTEDEYTKLLNSGLMQGFINNDALRLSLKDALLQKHSNLDEDLLFGTAYADVFHQATSEISKVQSIDDAIIRTDGSIIKTNPQDTLVALKNIPLSMEKARMEANKNLGGLDGSNSLEKKLNTIIDVLSKILSKDLKVEMPPQTRQDLDLIMCGGMV